MARPVADAAPPVRTLGPLETTSRAPATQAHISKAACPRLVTEQRAGRPGEHRVTGDTVHREGGT